jgi:CheY-like chemotaxis protein
MEQEMEAVRGTALIVDDEPEIRLLVRRQLEGAGYAVLEAPDGDEALDLLLDGLRPNVVLLDLRMPRVDGLDVIKELHSRGLIEEIPVVAFSAHGCAALFDELLCLGCRDCVSKPYTHEQLLDAVEAVAAQELHRPVAMPWMKITGRPEHALH